MYSLRFSGFSMSDTCYQNLVAEFGEEGAAQKRQRTQERVDRELSPAGVDVFIDRKTISVKSNVATFDIVQISHPQSDIDYGVAPRLTGDPWEQFVDEIVEAGKNPPV
jgi:hypothetical protein